MFKDFLAVFSGKNRENYIYSIFLEAQVRKIIVNWKKEKTKEQQKKKIGMVFSYFLFFSDICAAENQFRST